MIECERFLNTLKNVHTNLRVIEDAELNTLID